MSRTITNREELPAHMPKRYIFAQKGSICQDGTSQRPLSLGRGFLTPKFWIDEAVFVKSLKYLIHWRRIKNKPFKKRSKRK